MFLGLRYLKCLAQKYKKSCWSAGFLTDVCVFLPDALKGQSVQYRFAPCNAVGQHLNGGLGGQLLVLIAYAGVLMMNGTGRRIGTLTESDLAAGKQFVALHGMDDFNQGQVFGFVVEKEAAAPTAYG